MKLRSVAIQYTMLGFRRVSYRSFSSCSASASGSAPAYYPDADVSVCLHVCRHTSAVACTICLCLHASMHICLYVKTEIRFFVYSYATECFLKMSSFSSWPCRCLQSLLVEVPHRSVAFSRVFLLFSFLVRSEAFSSRVQRAVCSALPLHSMQPSIRGRKPHDTPHHVDRDIWARVEDRGRGAECVPRAKENSLCLPRCCLFVFVCGGEGV